MRVGGGEKAPGGAAGSSSRTSGVESTQADASPCLGPQCGGEAECPRGEAANRDGPGDEGGGGSYLTVGRGGIHSHVTTLPAPLESLATHVCHARVVCHCAPEAGALSPQRLPSLSASCQSLGGRARHIASPIGAVVAERSYPVALPQDPTCLVAALRLYSAASRAPPSDLGQEAPSLRRVQRWRPPVRLRRC